MTTLQARAGVGQKLVAPRAQAAGRLMMVAAINPHHGRHRLPFARQPRLAEVVFLFHNPILPKNYFGSIDVNQETAGALSSPGIL
jgi:hypothetical protein